MKKTIFTIILTAIVVVALNAQTPQQNFEWAKHLIVDVNTTPVRMIASPSGDVYTIASPQTDENYDYYANAKNFITKLNAEGDTLWTKQINNYNISTTNNDYSVYAEDLALDNDGNLYITGWFMQRVDFDSGIDTYILSSDTWVNGFQNIYGRDAFVLKLNAQGNFVWAQKYSNGGAYSERFYSLVVDNAGNIYAAGQNSMNANDGMLYKINANNGNVIWSKAITGNKPRINLDNTNHLVLTGYFSGTADFDPGTSVYNLTSNGLKDVYLMKLDNAGNFVWANQLGGTEHDAGKSLTTDNLGNVFITGYYTGTVTSSVNGTSTTLPIAAGTNGFIAKLNATDGNFLWISSFRNAPNQSGPLDDIGRGIALDQAENVYVTGAAYTNPNNPYNTYDGITNFGQQYHGYGGTDIAIFKLNNTDGNFAWINIIGGIGNDSGKDIAVDSDNNIFVTGLYNDNLGQTAYFQDSIDFDPSPQSVYMLAGNSSELANRFLMKLTLRTFASVSHAMCEGDVYDFNGNSLTNTGVYYDTLINVAGYDSIVTLTLNVFLVTTNSLFEIINQGDVYDFNGVLLNTSGVYTDTLTSVNGCDSVWVLTLTVENITGINNVAGNQELKIYPNPTNGIVYFSATANVQATNTLGQVIADKKNINSLDLSNQPTGVYFLTLTNDNGQIIKRDKIVKE